MKVCVKCRREMRCKSNGVLCHYGGGHTYPGDLFKCNFCGNEIIVTNTSPSHFTMEQLAGQTLIEMER